MLCRIAYVAKHRFTKHIHSTESGLVVFQFQQGGNLFDLHQHSIKLDPSMSSRDAETSPRHEDGDRGKPHHHHGEATLQTFARKGGNFRRIVQHHGDDGTVKVAKDVQAHVHESHSEVIRVVP